MQVSLFRGFHNPPMYGQRCDQGSSSCWSLHVSPSTQCFPKWGSNVSGFAKQWQWSSAVQKTASSCIRRSCFPSWAPPSQHCLFCAVLETDCVETSPSHTQSWPSRECSALDTCPYFILCMALVVGLKLSFLGNSHIVTSCRGRKYFHFCLALGDLVLVMRCFFPYLSNTSSFGKNYSVSCVSFGGYFLFICLYWWWWCRGFYIIYGNFSLSK